MGQEGALAVDPGRNAQAEVMWTESLGDCPVRSAQGRMAEPEGPLIGLGLDGNSRNR